MSETGGSTPEPAPAEREQGRFVCFTGHPPIDERAAHRPRRRRNEKAYVGRGLSLLSVMVTIVTIVVLDVALHIPGSGWGLYVTYAGVVLATGLAISGIVFSAIGLARIRTRGGGGVAATGLALGIVFAFAPLWIGLAIGIIITIAASVG